MGDYVIKQAATAWIPVWWDELGDGGAVVRNRVELKLERIGREEFNRLWAPIPDDATAAERAANDRMLFDRLVKDWRGIAVHPGEPAPFTPDHTNWLLDQPTFPGAFGEAYLRFWQAIPETRLGNLEPSPAGGQGAAAATVDQTATEPHS